VSKADQIRALREAALMEGAADRQKAALKRVLAIPEVRARVVQRLAPGALPAKEPISYTHRDADKRRAYMKSYMARKRAEKKEQGR